jgi:hypothetical protein
VVRGAFQDDGDVRDATATGGQRHRLSGTNPFAEIQRFERLPNPPGDILDARPLERLTDA